MFGLPNHHPLSKAVAVLTRDHEHTVGGVTGTEEPLLLMLERAIHSDTSGATSSGAGGTGAVLDAAALDLRDSISRVVPGTVPELLPQRLEAWVSRLVDERAEWDLRMLCADWTVAIRELLQPTRRVPVKDQHCPACGYARTTVTNPDGEDVVRPALEATLTGADSVLRCLVCTEEWRADIWEKVFGASGLPGALPV
ncbi:MAG: hypothetical protein ABS888_00185 [Eubacteriales bacterium]